jgi:hypothetical protein
MIPVGNHGLSCLGPEDYAATALYMQETAFRVEAALIAERDSINEYRLRTSMEFVTTVTASYASAGGLVMPDGRQANGVPFGGATVLGGAAPVTSLSTGSVTLIPPRTGWYDIGGYANVIPAGAVTVGSERVMYILVNQVPDLPATDGSTLFQERVTDTNTGGEFLNLSGLIFLVGGRSALLQLLIAHTNVASNLVIQAGAKMWLAYYGPKGGIVVNA